jgi:uncharacterized OsmC-like protein
MTTVTESSRRNGVDTATLFATLDAVKGSPEIAKFQFRASNTWLTGAHNRSTISGFYGAGQEMEHQQVTTVDADHPAVLVGEDHAPSPVEYLLHAVAACLTAGIANVAAARGVDLTKVTSTVEGDIDLLGILGLSGGSVRNGYQQIRVTFHIDGDADEATLRRIVEQSRNRSAVYDVLSNGTAVHVDVVTGCSSSGSLPARPVMAGRRPGRGVTHDRDRHRHRRRRTRRTRGEPLVVRGRARARDPGTRPGRGAVAFAAVGLAAPADPELDDPAARFQLSRAGSRRVPQRGRVRRLSRPVRHLVRRPGRRADDRRRSIARPTRSLVPGRH